MKNKTRTNSNNNRIYMLFFLALSLFLLIGCCGCGKLRVDKDSQGQLRVLCTTFPAYDWAKNIVGDSENISVELLVDTGVDLHSYQPKARDIVKISHSDVLVYVGGESDTWVREAVKQSGNPSLITVNMMEIVGDLALEEEEISGFNDTENNEIEYDEHIWLSVSNAKLICERYAEIFAMLDSENYKTYTDNCELYIQRLNEVDSEYIEMMEKAKLDTIIVGDRFPFLYLVKSYGIKYYAAYSGCSADAEASVHMVTYLAHRMKDYDIPVVFTVDSGKDDLAKTVFECANDEKYMQEDSNKILNLNSMQSVTREEIDAGCTYLSLMQKNLEALKIALEYN